MRKQIDHTFIPDPFHQAVSKHDGSIFFETKWSTSRASTCSDIYFAKWTALQTEMGSKVSHHSSQHKQCGQPELRGLKTLRSIKGLRNNPRSKIIIAASTSVEPRNANPEACAKFMKFDRRWGSWSWSRRSNRTDLTWVEIMTLVKFPTPAKYSNHW